MTAAVLQLPGTAPAPAERSTLNLEADELVEASGGYVRSADQLKALHALGFVRAWRAHNGKGRVVLERAHYDAVVRGQFATRPLEADPAAARSPLPPNRAGFRRRFGNPKVGA
jgi:hypothetical protein